MLLSHLIIALILPSLYLCAVVEFGGIYQQHADSSSCVSANIWTGDCSCPVGYLNSCFTIVSDGEKGHQTNVCFCEPQAVEAGGYYGGSYLQDGDSCTVENRYLGSCSCAVGYVSSSVRIFTNVQNYNNSRVSRIITCTKPDLRDGAGNFKGIFQTDARGNCVSPNPLTGACDCPQNACAWMGLAAVEGQVSRVAACHSSLQADADPSTIEGKTLFGYQGWFSTPANPATGWRHWSHNGALAGNTANIDVWPDLSEFDPDELYPSGLHYADGKVAGVYTSNNAKTITRHFQWMQTYGLDGVFLQRFVNEITHTDDPMFTFRNNVTQHIISAAAATGRVWAIEYDISGADVNNLLNILTADWSTLVNTIKILASPQYLHHNGKPVVVIWGPGFTDRGVNQDTALAVIKWFKNAGVYVIGGVPYDWRTSSGDSMPNFQQVYNSYDAVSPWAVGRYGDDVSFQSNYVNIASLDIPYAKTNNVGYGPIIFPGFSWWNMHSGSTPFNQIPRKGGAFLMTQANAWIKKSGVLFLKIAMFDEMDEGTAMFKAASTKQQTPSDGTFLFLSMDGTNMASDAYLCLAGTITARNH